MNYISERVFNLVTNAIQDMAKDQLNPYTLPPKYIATKGKEQSNLLSAHHIFKLCYETESIRQYIDALSERERASINWRTVTKLTLKFFIKTTLPNTATREVLNRISTEFAEAFKQYSSGKDQDKNHYFNEYRAVMFCKNKKLDSPEINYNAIVSYFYDTEDLCEKSNIPENYNVAIVKFKDCPKLYHYKCTIRTDLKAQDEINVPVGPHNDIEIAEVVELNRFMTVPNNCKWICKRDKPLVDVPKKETKMNKHTYNKVLFETRDFYDGNELDKFSDDELISLMVKISDQIDKMTELNKQFKSKKLDKQIQYAEVDLNKIKLRFENNKDDKTV